MNSLEAFETYVTTVAPTGDIATTLELRNQCRIDSHEEDALLEHFREAATQKVEADTQLLLRPVTMRMQVDRWPCNGKALEIRKTPVTAVSSITYVATDGTTTTWSSLEYIADTASIPARITPGYGYSWPSVRCQPGSIKVTFTGGYAAGAAPGVAKQAVLLLVADWYENRELQGTIPPNLEMTYWNLLRSISGRAI